MRNLHRRFDGYFIGQICGGNFAKICGIKEIAKVLQISYSTIIRGIIKDGAFIGFRPRLENSEKMFSLYFLNFIF